MQNPDPDKIKPGKYRPGKNQTQNYLKYSGMAFQLGAAVLMGTLAGKYIDQYLQLEKPYFTLLLALLGVIAGLYSILKDFIHPGNKPE